MKVNTIFRKSFLVFFIAVFSCEDYLDIVPDRTQEISLLFNRRESAFMQLLSLPQMN